MSWFCRPKAIALDKHKCYNGDMFVVDLVQWWYAKGWSTFFGDMKTVLKNTAATFSIGDLLKTLFAPYRQIDVGGEGQPFFARLTSKLISRLIGFITRLALIICGLILMLIETVVMGVLLIAWPLAPLLPFAGIILTVMGVAV